MHATNTSRFPILDCMVHGWKVRKEGLTKTTKSLEQCRMDCNDAMRKNGTCKAWQAHCTEEDVKVSCYLNTLITQININSPYFNYYILCVTRIWGCHI